jgi:transcriptional regulator with XRE-family HTH domain
VDKAIHGEAQRRLTALLRACREEAGLRQVDVAERLGVHQSFVSKYETGERRLDLVELEQVCAAVGIALSAFVMRYQTASDR